jgi:hypothetical protein
MVFIKASGFKFSDMGDEILAGLQYGFYGSSREESYAALDPLVGELGDELNSIDFSVKLLQQVVLIL